MARPKTLEDWENAIGTLAQGIVNLEQVVKAQGEILRGIDARIRALTALVDHHHSILTEVAGLPPRPKGDPLAN